MVFVATNSCLTIKPSLFDINCRCKSKSYEQHGCFWTNFEGGQNFIFKLRWVFLQ